MAVLWLTVLVPILAAAVLKRAPLPGIGVAAAAMTAIAAGVGTFAWSAWSATITWLPRNGQPLVELGLRSDPLASAVLMSLSLTLMGAILAGRLQAEHLSNRLLQLGAAAGVMLAPDLAQGVLCVGLVALLDERRTQGANALGTAAGMLLLAGH